MRPRWGFAELDELRTTHGLTITPFCAIVGITPRTYERRRTRHQAGLEGVKGPWPHPAQDRLELAVLAAVERFPAWGHRKIAALLRHDGHPAPESTVLRLLRRHGLVLPVDYQRERRQLARDRREAFLDPPDRRNRVWQTDFSELETRGGGTWQMSGVIDYTTKYSLACPVTVTKTWRDAVDALERARETVHVLLGRPLIDDCTCPTTGEVTPVIVVSDNGSAYRAAGFARYIDARPELRHIRTRVRAPETNGVIERFYGSAKYEDLDRDIPDDGPDLALRLDAFRDLYNRVRPHEHLDWQRPHDRYVTDPITIVQTRQNPTEA